MDLTQPNEYHLTARTNGTALSGHQAGWFRTGGGRKALVFLRDPRQAIVIPHREGYLLMLSPADPEAFLRSLRSAAVSAWFYQAAASSMPELPSIKSASSVATCCSSSA
jgi:hypothetical protein